MMKMAIALAGLLAFGLFAAAPSAKQGYRYWSAAELKSYEQKLAPKITATNRGAVEDKIIDYDNYFSAMVHRDGNIGAEMHDAWADVYVISSGSGTLEVGGTLSGAKTTGPGELRGGTIQGGMRQKVAPGDIVHIPAKTPHAMLIESGKQITYFIFKVKPE
jgi:mannose-6-phosphate isomerase-like protein (cupin superfamily)